MNDSAGQQHREQGAMPEFDIGDYITNSNNNDTQHQQDMDFFTDFHHQGPSASNMNLHQQQQQQQQQSTMSSQNSMGQNVLGSQGGMEYLPQNQPPNVITAEMLKGRLEQQIKLQQLQQLQNHILQQQIELISGHSSMNDQQKEVIFHGLLTPGPSNELRAISTKDLVSPMMLQPEMYGSAATAIVNQLSPHHIPNPSMSAPAALAFQTTPPFPLPSPAEPEYDLSPLTSPWLLPVSGSQQQQQQQQHEHHQHAHQRPARLKRAVSSSGDEQGSMRKRTAHSTVADSRRNGPTSSSSSSTSTPAARGMGSGLGLGLAPLLSSSNDTPSPVDLSMPPPAPPSNTNVNPQPTMSSSASSSTSISTPGSTSVSPNIAPVTPASIMNLGRLRTGLAPSNSSTQMKGGDAGVGPKRSGKGKGVARPGTAGANGVTTRARRGSVAKPGISPNLKPILPGATAIAPAPTSPLTHPSHIIPSNYTLMPNAANNMPGPRKTSHKAAEQKRRDFLKCSFDELRLLLPPVPVLEETGDEPPLPGSMPPRGPPKGDADGPNRGVSKLALLRCGNAYIRDLKDKVDRRDDEIDKLRHEVRRLRLLVAGEDAGAVDLERDVDEGAVRCAHVEECGMDGDEEE